jgi:hypothetical protein
MNGLSTYTAISPPIRATSLGNAILLGRGSHDHGAAGHQGKDKTGETHDEC